MFTDRQLQANPSQDTSSNGKSPLAEANLSQTETRELEGQSPRPTGEARLSAAVPQWQRLNLKKKATLLAIAIGTVPVFLTGAISYTLASRQLQQQISTEQAARTADMADKVSRFLKERTADIEDFASMPTFNDASLPLSVQQQTKALRGIVARSGKLYNSLGFFQLNGNLIAQGEPGEPLPNHRDRDYFQEILKTDKTAIAQPRPSKTTGVFSLHFAAPVKDAASGKTRGIIRSRATVEDLESVIQNYGLQGKTEYVLIDGNQQAFISNQDSWEGGAFLKNLPILKDLVGKREVKFLPATDQDGVKWLVTYVPIANQPGQSALNWSAVLLTDTKVAFAAQRQLLLTTILGTGLTALFVGWLAAYLANRATRPLLAAAKTVEKIGQGEFEARVAVEGEDELANLSSNINQMADQIQHLLSEQEVAARREAVAERERQQQEILQRELLQLLNDVEGAASGDLTVRAEITAGQIGIVADFFNAIIENLREIVTEVKQAASQVNKSVGEKEGEVRQLAAEAMGQAAQITATLDAVEQMARSIQEVAQNAQQAADIARHASQQAETGGTAMDRTVESILELRETVAETAKKVKRLGESSQHISKVVALINQIALKTNLLAVNASIEAARAGEEGRGFAVVAEEVGELAAQSANATKEIEQIVEAIQRETGEVVKAMEVGTSQVVTGTNLVEAAKRSLGEIVQVSHRIDQLLQSISSATVSQNEKSQLVANLMEEIAKVSEGTAQASHQVSSSLQETVAITQQLQEKVGTFKVNE